MNENKVITRNVRRAIPATHTPIYVGRRTSYHPRHGANYSQLGNPYHLSSGMDRESSIDLYRTWLRNRKGDSPADLALIDLADRIMAGEHLALGCFCHPLPCHADVIREELLILIGQSNA